MYNLYQFTVDYMGIENHEVMRPYFDEKLIIMELIEVGNYKGLLKYLRKVEEKYK